MMTTMGRKQTIVAASLGTAACCAAAVFALVAPAWAPGNGLAPIRHTMEGRIVAENSQGGDGEIVRAYRVMPGGAPVLEEQEPDSTLATLPAIVRNAENGLRLWKLWNAIVPETYARQVVRYEVWTDGPDGDTGSVYQSDANPSEWVLAFDPADAFDAEGRFWEEDARYTAVHELGHLASLGAGQIDYAAETCATYFAEEGCALPGSHLFAFVRAFHAGTAETPQGRADGDAAETFDAAPDDYVDEYAALNPEEDFAETFAWWVMDGELPASGLAKTKVAWFAARPALAALGADVRAKLAAAK